MCVLLIWITFTEGRLWASQSTVTQASGDVAGREFVQQLLSRGLFESAVEYCERQIGHSVSADRKGVWQLQLSDCYRQRAWTLGVVNRNSLLDYSITRLTEFLSQNTVSPVHELSIRLQQIEMLTDAARMQLIVSQAGNWFVAPGLKGRESVTPISDVSRHQQAVAKAQSLAIEFIEQLNEIRRDLEPDTVRLLRDRARHILTVCPWLLAELNAPGDDRESRLNSALRQCQQLLRSTSDEELRSELQLQVAEVLLRKGHLDAFSVRQSADGNSLAPANHQPAWMALRVRGLLRQGKATEALQEIVNYQNSSSLGPELLVLRAEALLAVYEIVSALGDGELQRAAGAEFETQRNTAVSMVSGVWREAAEQLNARYERVSQVGPDLADDLEAVQNLATTGKFNEARGLLNQILTILPPSASLKTTGMLKLQQGELEIQLKAWDSAILVLNQATQDLEQTGDQTAAAAADLLCIYAVGRRWEDDSSPDKSSYKYSKALSEHLTRFSQQETSNTARLWLIRILRVTDPSQAADHLLTVAEKDNRPDKKANSLCDAGELLLSADIMRETSQAPSTPPAQLQAESVETAVQEVERTKQRFRQMAEETLNSASDELSALHHCTLQLQLMEFDLLDVNGPKNDWEKMLSQLTSVRSVLSENSSSGTENASDASVSAALPEPASSQQSSGKRIDGSGGFPQPNETLFELVLSRRCDLFSVIVSSRTRPSFGTAEDVTKVLETAELPEQLRALRLLNSQFVRAQLKRTVSSVSTRDTAEMALMLSGNRLLGQVSLEVLEKRTSAVTDPMELMKLLEFVVNAGHAAGDFKLQAKLTARLFEEQLSEEQIRMMARILASADNPVKSGNQNEVAVFRFWQLVLKQSPQGSDAWLEASFQTAFYQKNSNQSEDALRVLNVVDVLYPEWGNPDRKTRAAELRRQMGKP